MQTINMAPRAHGRKPGPMDDCKILSCARCNEEILVTMGYCSTDPVYCIECVQELERSRLSPAGQAPEPKKPWWKIW